MVRSARICVLNTENGKSTYLRCPIQHLILLELYSTKEQENQIPVVDIEYPVAQNPMEPTRPRRNAAVIGELMRKIDYIACCTYYRTIIRVP